MSLRLLALLLVGAPARAGESTDDFDDDEVIVVTGLGREEPADDAVHRTRVLTREVLEATGAQTVADALETLGGIQIEDGVGGEGIRMQGLEPEHTLVLIDGVRVGGRVSGTVDLRRLQIADVEQIEIVEGPSATLYGSDAMAGVVHIRTRRGTRGTRAELRLLTGRFASQTRAVDDSVPEAIPTDVVDTVDANATLHAGTERFKTRLTAGWHAAEANDATPDNTGTTGNAYRQASISGSADLDVAEGHRWAAQARWQSFRRWGVDALPTGSVLDRTNLTAEWGASLGPTLEFDDRRRLTVLFGARGWTDQLRMDQRGSDSQDTYQRTRDVLGQARLRYDTVVGERHVLAVGTEVLGERLIADRIDPKTVHRTRIAVFAQDQWDVTGDDRVSVEMAARGDLDTRFGTYFTPRAGLRIKASDQVLVRLSGGRGFRAPDFREMFLVFENAASGYRVDGNVDLRPETSWNLQGGIEWAPTGGLELGLRGFHNALENLIQADLIDGGEAGQPSRFGYRNIASARTTGGEVEVAAHDADTGRVSVSYRFTDTRDHETGLALSGRARHQISTATLLHLPVWSSRLSVRGSWQGARDFVTTVDGESVSRRAPPALHLDVSVLLSPHERVDLQLGVENLADVGADPASLLQTRPRRAFVGLTGRIGRAPSKESP